MGAPIIWIIIAGILAVAEILTSSFYLLLAAFGALMAAIAAYMGASDTAQILIASCITLTGWALLYKFGGQALKKNAQQNSDMNMDIGQSVKLSEIANDGKLFVQYRGARWSAELAKGETAPNLTEHYLIHEIQGSTLILKSKG